MQKQNFFFKRNYKNTFNDQNIENDLDRKNKP